MRLALLIAVVMTPVFADAWDGYDSSTGVPVDIERGNLVRSGRDIEIFDYEEGEYRDVHVERVRRSGRTVELEIYDYESGEYRYLDMFD